MGAEGVWGLSVPFSQFCCETTPVQKHKVYSKEEREREERNQERDSTLENKLMATRGEVGGWGVSGK